MQKTIETELQHLILNRGNVNAINLLKLIVSEFSRRKNLNVLLEDQEVIKIIKRFIFNEEELLKLSEKNSAKIDREKCLFNISYLGKYIPSEATEEEILEFVLREHPEIVNIEREWRSKFIGIVMKAFSGRVDGNKVKEILNRL